MALFCISDGIFGFPVKFWFENIYNTPYSIKFQKLSKIDQLSGFCNQDLEHRHIPNLPMQRHLRRLTSALDVNLEITDSTTSKKVEAFH